MTERKLQAVLYAVFRQSRDNLPMDLDSIAALARGTTQETQAALSALHQLGLIDAARLRLTMKGLVIAVRKWDRAKPLRPSSTIPAVRRIGRIQKTFVIDAGVHRETDVS